MLDREKNKPNYDVPFIITVISFLFIFFFTIFSIPLSAVGIYYSYIYKNKLTLLANCLLLGLAVFTLILSLISKNII